MTTEANITAQIEVIMAYKTGQLDLEEATQRFCFLTGLGKDLGEKFLKGLTRDNVLPIDMTP